MELNESMGVATNEEVSLGAKEIHKDIRPSHEEKDEPEKKTQTR
jgi:hypothetical protein